MWFNLFFGKVPDQTYRDQDLLCIDGQHVPPPRICPALIISACSNCGVMLKCENYHEQIAFDNVALNPARLMPGYPGDPPDSPICKGCPPQIWVEDHRDQRTTINLYAELGYLTSYAHEEVKNQFRERKRYWERHLKT